MLGTCLFEKMIEMCDFQSSRFPEITFVEIFFNFDSFILLSAHSSLIASFLAFCSAHGSWPMGAGPAPGAQGRPQGPGPGPPPPPDSTSGAPVGAISAPRANPGGQFLTRNFNVWDFQIKVFALKVLQKWTFDGNRFLNSQSRFVSFFGCFGSRFLDFLKL